MKRRNRKGFTLAELLIVVAIIAVLVAISIPIFTSQMTKAKIAVDQSNVRSAKAAAAAEYMTNDESGPVEYIYDGSHAIKVESASTVTSLKKPGYGKSDNAANKNNETGATGTPKNGYVLVTIDGSGDTQITAKWVNNFVISNKGTLSAASLEEQVKKEGLDKDDIVSFTAEDGTVLNNSTNSSLADMFKGYDNLKTINLGNATLKSGNLNLFRDVPKSVESITLPQCDSPYDIRGTWYFADGTSINPNNTGSGSNVNEDTRITPKAKAQLGNVIYRNPPAGVTGKRVNKQQYE